MANGFQMQMSPHAEGINAAIERVKEYDLKVNDNLKNRITEKLEPMIEEKISEDHSVAGLVLFSELVAIAEISRFNFDEPPLTKRQMEEFFEEYKSFINSLFHI